MELTKTGQLAAIMMFLLLTGFAANAHEPTPGASAAATGAHPHSASASAAPMAAQPRMSGMPMKGSESSFIGHLRNPDYMHTLLNPMPVYGLSMGVLSLCIGLFYRNRVATVAALVLIFLSGFAAWPVYYFGEEAYDRVRAMSDPIGTQWLDEHMARAEKLIYIFYALAAGALAAILTPLKWPRTAFPLAVGVLALGVVNLGLGGWISYAGGHVRHPEFRFEEPPSSKMEQHTHSHGGGEEAAEHGMEHGAAPANSTGSQQPAPMGHGSMPGMEPNKSGAANEQLMEHGSPQPAAPTQEQLDASRAQLEASRLQLEASRKQLEATEAAKASGAPIPPPQPTPSEPEHKHDH